MVLKRKLSRACAFIVSTDLCDVLATVDHLAINMWLTHFTGHLSTWRHTKETRTQAPVVDYTFKSIHAFILFSIQNTCSTFSSSIRQPRSKAKCVIQTCLSEYSAIYRPIKSTPALFPFIWSATQHLLSLASRLWFALISQWISLCHITVL